MIELSQKLLAGFSGVLQVDGYAVYNQLARPTRAGGAVTLPFCWSHLRRKFYELYVGGNQPIATEALARIKLLYDIDAEIRGLPPEVRRSLRQARSKPSLAVRMASSSRSAASVLRSASRAAWDGIKPQPEPRQNVGPKHRLPLISMQRASGMLR